MSYSLFARLKRRYAPTSIESRRQFLASISAMGAAALLSNQVRGTGQSGHRRIVVVGAGLAGLACAHELLAVGYQVTLFEARNQVGGRVRSFSNFIPEKNVEGGAELIGENHPTWWAYKAKFGLDFLEMSEDAELNMPIYLRGELLDYATGARLYESMEATLAQLNSLSQAINADQPWKSPTAAEFDKLTVADWIEQCETDELIKRLLSVQMSSDNGVANNRASLLGMLTAIKGGGVQEYWNQTETHRCQGGNQQLATRLAQVLGHERVHLNLPVESIDCDGATCVVRCADGRAVQCDDVVLAAPPSTWSKIRFNPELPKFLKPQMGKAVKYLAAVKERFWLKDGLSQYSMTDGPISQTWELTDAQPNEPPTAGIIAFSGGPAAESCLQFQQVDRDARYIAEFKKMYPAFEDNFISSRMMDWPNDPWTLGGYSFPAPGQILQQGPVLYDGLDQLHFCGEHTCYKFVGYMEGGLNSGVALANRLAKRDGLMK